MIWEVITKIECHFQKKKLRYFLFTIVLRKTTELLFQ